MPFARPLRRRVLGVVVAGSLAIGGAAAVLALTDVDPLSELTEMVAPSSDAAAEAGAEVEVDEMVDPRVDTAAARQSRSSSPSPESTAAIAADVAGEVGRAGRQLDPVPAAPSVNGSSSVDPATTPGNASGADGARGHDGTGDGGAGAPGLLSVRSDAAGDFGAEGAGGSASLWPEWATCEFDDGRTTDPGVRSVVVDRDRQRSWFCDGVDVVRVFPITTARSQPDPGVYEVYAKDMHTSSTFGGGYSTMTHFVAFTYGKFQGARVAFHSVPVYPGGEWVQPLESVGDLSRHGDSSGCIRALPADAEAIWDWLDVGDLVRVTT